MRGSLLHSLLELADATSENLEFAHRDDVQVSFGEETITETNLLELRRRHPEDIKLNTFGKKTESLIGADWEWHIIGRARMLRMRVQAKRLQKNGVLKIPHTVKSSGKEQIDLLIEDAKANRLRPVYCIYSAENQRDYWKTKSSVGGLVDFQFGCLLACAHTVKSEMPKSLSEIEKQCVPWHYLVEQGRYQKRALSETFGIDGRIRFIVASDRVLEHSEDERATEDDRSRDFPTIDELNASETPKGTMEGVIEANDPEYERRRSAEDYLERGVSRLLEIDVREIPERRSIEDEGDQ